MTPWNNASIHPFFSRADGSRGLDPNCSTLAVPGQGGWCRVAHWPPATCPAPAAAVSRWRTTRKKNPTLLLVDDRTVAFLFFWLKTFSPACLAVIYNRLYFLFKNIVFHLKNRPPNYIVAHQPIMSAAHTTTTTGASSIFHFWKYELTENVPPESCPAEGPPLMLDDAGCWSLMPQFATKLWCPSLSSAALPRAAGMVLKIAQEI